MSLMLDDEGFKTRLLNKSYHKIDGTYVLKDDDEGIPFFRKYFDFNMNGHTESAVVDKLYSAQVRDPQILHIFNVTHYYYDAELLQTTKNISDVDKIDILACLNAMNRLGIVYVDMHHENMGFSQIDKCWKLFDFDASGLIKDQNTWLIEPVMCKNHSKAYEIAETLIFPLIDIDRILYNYYFN